MPFSVDLPPVPVEMQCSLMQLFNSGETKWLTVYEACQKCHIITAMNAHDSCISGIVCTCTVLVVDPKQLLELLSQALSMDQLSDLLKKEHESSSLKLDQLKEKLESEFNKTVDK